MKKQISIFLLIFSVLLINNVIADELKEFQKTTVNSETFKLGSYYYYPEFPEYIVSLSNPPTFKVNLFDTSGNAYLPCFNGAETNCIKEVVLEIGLKEEKCIYEGGGFDGLKCNFPEKLAIGQYDFYFRYSRYDKNGHWSGSKVQFSLIIPGCGDKTCSWGAGENSINCCMDCGPLALFKCENNVPIETCGNGLCESLYLENQGSCCDDCGCPSSYYKCEDHACSRYTLFKRIGIWFSSIFG